MFYVQNFSVKTISMVNHSIFRCYTIFSIFCLTFQRQYVKLIYYMLFSRPLDAYILYIWNIYKNISVTWKLSKLQHIQDCSILTFKVLSNNKTQLLLYIILLRGWRRLNTYNSIKPYGPLFAYLIVSFNDFPVEYFYTFFNSAKTIM